MAAPRTRRVVKWLGTVLCALIAVTWCLSTQRAFLWNSPGLRYEFSLARGALSLGWRPPEWRIEDEDFPTTPGWGIARYAGGPELEWWPARGGLRSWEWISVPLWMPFVVLAVPTAVLWYQDRKNVRATVRRVQLWLTPRRPRKVGFLLIVLFCVLHVLGLFGSSFLFIQTYQFFVDHRPYGSLVWIMGAIVSTLFLTTPLWGVVWAWAWTRFRNWLFRRQPGHHCLTCGYDLTGNVSGRCPECGAEITSRTAVAVGPRRE